MSFSIGPSSSGMGPRSTLDHFGTSQRKGDVFNPNVVRRMLAYLQPHRWKMLSALFLTMCKSALTLLSPYLIKVAIDQYIIPGHLAGLMQITLLLLASFLGLFVVTMTQGYLLAWVGQRVLSTLRSDLFRHLQRLHLGYQEGHIVGVTVSHVINDVAEINQLLSEGVITLLGDLVVLIGVIVIMIIMSPLLAVITFSVIPLMVLASWLFSRAARAAFRETRSKVAAVVGDLAEDINGMRTIQAFTQEKASQDRFLQVNKDNRNAYINAMSLSFIFLPVIEFLGMLSTGIVLWFGGHFVLSGQVTLGIIVAFLTYVSKFFQPLQELSLLYTTFQSAMAGGEQVIKLLDTPIEVKDQPGAINLTSLKGKITFSDVSFQYNPTSPIVLKNINMLIQPGQTVALVGPTGAGKSTIANLVARFYDVTSGSICIDDLDVHNITQASLRKFVRVISQDPFLFSRSITDNIRYGAPNTSEQQIMEAARQANASEFIEKLPKGYETRILEGGVNVSQGQRQLLSLARAFLTDPRILILDEATANIDTVTESLIQEALGRLLHDRTAIVIAHRLTTVRNADWVYVLDQGQITEEGTHANLLARKGLYSDLYERQFING